MQLFTLLLDKKNIHPSWKPLLIQALETLDPNYLQTLSQDTTWFPGMTRIFNAFSLPLADTRYILFGESPYPRAASANGYAFWDAAVGKLWSSTGLAPAVNRATSLRNLIKMLLIAEGKLSAGNPSQGAIAMLDKSHYVQAIDELFANFGNHGILLLNASLVFRRTMVREDANIWRPFMGKLLDLLREYQPLPTLILLGSIAAEINRLPASKLYPKFSAEHPFNISFITNTKVIQFFKPFHLLARSAHSNTKLKIKMENPV